jgi:hypothetical protein
MAARRLNSTQEQGPSCVSPAAQLKREWPPWLEFGWIPGNLGDLSKGIIFPDVSEFESDMPSHAVGLFERC